MRKVGLFEAKQKLSELVRRAKNGERIIITRHGETEAMLIPPQPEVDLREVFASIDRVRKRVRMPKGVTIKELIEEGRK